ncbi:MAG TPA: hypothetical protein VEI82_08880 [Myxococcota bacterium]|nr:hypothetical protein [Myxococcota bacterium]
MLGRFSAYSYAIDVPFEQPITKTRCVSTFPVATSCAMKWSIAAASTFSR